MTKSNFEKYAELKGEVARLEEYMEELKPLIMAEMPEDGTAVELEDKGVFSIVKKKVWEYSEDVKKIR